MGQIESLDANKGDNIDSALQGASTLGLQLEPEEPDVVKATAEGTKKQFLKLDAPIHK